MRGFAVDGRDCSFFQIIQTGCGDRQICSLGIKGFFPRGVNLTTDNHLVAMVGINTAKLPFPHMPSSHTHTRTLLAWFFFFQGTTHFQKHLWIVHTKRVIGRTLHIYIYIYIGTKSVRPCFVKFSLPVYRVSQEECARFQDGVPYVKVYRYIWWKPSRCVI
jgi:hypothetical protein